MNRDIGIFIRQVNGKVVYLNKYWTDRKGIQKLIDFEPESQNNINFKCKRFFVPYINKPITNHYNCLKYSFLNRSRVLITIDYLLNYTFKLLSFLRNIKIYYWNDIHAKDLKKNLFF